MRTEKELLQLLLDNIDKLETGLCYLTYFLWVYHNSISYDEKQKITLYIELKAPKKRKDCFHWKPNEKQPRIEWLKSQIEKL